MDLPTYILGIYCSSVALKELCLSCNIVLNFVLLIFSFLILGIIGIMDSHQIEYIIKMQQIIKETTKIGKIKLKFKI
jgi:hypothetical protein